MNARWINKTELKIRKNAKIETGKRYQTTWGDTVLIIRPTNAARTEFIAGICEPEDFDLVEYLNS